jgi:pseudouridine-5'-phosphate glycosidase
MIERELHKALSSAEEEGIKRGKVTPYLLGKMKEITGGKSLLTNLALLKNNISIAADIACLLDGSTNLKVY